jgi:hypothetical protein
VWKLAKDITASVACRRLYDTAAEVGGYSRRDCVASAQCYREARSSMLIGPSRLRSCPTNDVNYAIRLRPHQKTRDRNGTVA